LYHGTPQHSVLPHDIDAGSFADHIRFLKSRFDIVPLSEAKIRRRPGDRVRVAMTFDDGFRNNFEVAAPILKEYNVPATFFVCKRPAEPGKYLWFVYLQMLEKRFRHASFSFRGELVDMSTSMRSHSIRKLQQKLLNLKPHPQAMYTAIERELPPLNEFVSRDELNDRCAGMSTDELHELAASELFSVEAHTCDHPLLTRCTRKEKNHQLNCCVDFIEQVCGTKCSAVAYPSGDYDDETLKLVIKRGLAIGYAVDARLHMRADLEVPRIGIYSSSTAKLGFKAVWGGRLRSWGVRIG
jgi:peptidoglycan/xylan/chitin deacetylase (PgdA/CDA1 family)